MPPELLCAWWLTWLCSYVVASMKSENVYFTRRPLCVRHYTQVLRAWVCASLSLVWRPTIAAVREIYKRKNISRGLCSFLSVFCDLPLLLPLLLLVLSSVFTLEKFVFYFFPLAVVRSSRTFAAHQSGKGNEFYVYEIFCVSFSFCFTSASRKTRTGPSEWFFLLFRFCFARFVVARAYGRVLSL